MTKVYTHTGEIAASNAVALLPAVIGDDEAKPEQPKRDAEAILREIKALAEGLTPENAVEKRAALLAMLSGAVIGGQTATEGGE